MSNDSVISDERKMIVRPAVAIALARLGPSRGEAFVRGKERAPWQNDHHGRRDVAKGQVELRARGESWCQIGFRENDDLKPTATFDGATPPDTEKDPPPDRKREVLSWPATPS
jgi:hypothetical protein